MRPWLRSSPTARLWWLATRSRPVEGNHLLRVPVRWKSSGRILSLALLGGISLTAAAGPMESAAFAAPSAAPIAVAPLSAGRCAAAMPSQAAHTSLAPLAPLAPLAAPIITSPLAARAPAIFAVPAMPGSLLAAAPAFPIGGVPAGFSGTPARAATATSRALTACAIAPDDMRADLLAATQARRARAASAASTITLVTKHIPRARPAAPAPAQPAAPPTGAPITPPASGGPGGITPWTPVPGHPTYAMSDPTGDPYASQFGVCTWYAGFARPDEPLRQMGPANNWPTLAARYGLRTGSTPVAGATVYFAPGVQGSGGHVAHVEQVLGGGWFIISEMNFYWNGGGWGRVDWRYAYAAPGVTFIY
jgi:surface antigen